MECNHTLCLSCESPIIDYTVRPNHLLHFKCCKCDVSVLRDYVCRFKQTDLKVCITKETRMIRKEMQSDQF